MIHAHACQVSRENGGLRTMQRSSLVVLVLLAGASSLRGRAQAAEDVSIPKDWIDGVNSGKLLFSDNASIPKGR